MQSTTTSKAHRRGFRGQEWNSLTDWQRHEAKRLADEVDADGAYTISVRKMTYCGPDSGGDRGAAIFTASFPAGGPRQVVIERAGGRS